MSLFHVSSLHNVSFRSLVNGTQACPRTDFITCSTYLLSSHCALAPPTYFRTMTRTYIYCACHIDAKVLLKTRGNDHPS